MLAARKAPESVVKLMEGRPFVIENKFDGERVQVHKDGKTIRLFSRYVGGACDAGGQLDSQLTATASSIETRTTSRPSTVPL